MIGAVLPAAALVGIACDHAAMTTCCEATGGCGHYSCADCGLTWDDSAEGGEPFPFDEPLYTEDPGPCA